MNNTQDEFESLTDTGNDTTTGTGNDTANDTGNDRRRRHPVEGIVERRKHTRFTVDAWAEVMVKDGTLLFRGRVLDISLGGCYVETEARLRMPPATPVEIVFRMGERVFRCEGSSRMVRPGHGAGFLFDVLEPRTQWELEGLIRKLDGDDA